MKVLLAIILLLSFNITLDAQSVLTFKISDDKNPLTGATVLLKDQNSVKSTGSNGIVIFKDLSSGELNFRFSYVGHEESELSFFWNATKDTTIFIVLNEKEEAEEEVIVTATRTSRTISNTPTRTEIISGEELEEKSNMKPGEIRMLLSESTGIQAQQTSATSYNYSIRIQGLDGRYTQLLRDGFPLYSGFSGGLSIMQITPLDLRQVEVIKGSSSTLYGGGAIAGLINLVSKRPENGNELSFLTNATSAGGLDLSGFYAEKFGKIGLTVFGSRNSSSAYDPNDIGLSAIPKFERYSIQPRLFLYGSKTKADIGIGYIREDRIGGNMNYIKDGWQGYFEENNSNRLTSQFTISHELSANSSLQFKSSYTRFNRAIGIPNYNFEAVQQASFTEFSWNHLRKNMQWIAGANFLTDDLSESITSGSQLRDYHLNTFGFFIQHNWTINEKFILETGLRGDQVNNFGFELLPRVSALYRINSKLTSRIGGGFGYKSPTVFTEESERIQFRRVLPINQFITQNERSAGGNWDINYSTNIGSVGLSINHLFFYTRLKRPLTLVQTITGDKEFLNADGSIDTKGMETNLKLVFHDFKLFLGYTYTDANTSASGNKSWLPLTAKHRLNNILMYEVEEKWKLGLEAYYFSKQKLNNGSFGKAYWITGFMAEKIWEKFSLFINFENFTDTRQSNFGPLYTGSIDEPQFTDIYAPVEGFIINGGIKLRFGKSSH